MKIYLDKQFDKPCWKVTDFDLSKTAPIAMTSNAEIGTLLKIKGAYYSPCLINGEHDFCIVEATGYIPEKEYDTEETYDPYCPYCGHKMDWDDIGNDMDGILICSNCNGEVEYHFDMNPVWTTAKHKAPDYMEVN